MAECHSSTADDGPPTVMFMAAQLAKYNKVPYKYRLLNERGPAHAKIFTMSLQLGNEEFIGEGASIKKAQRSAAINAVGNSKLPRPSTFQHEVRRSRVPLRQQSSRMCEAWSLLRALTDRYGLPVSIQSAAVLEGDGCGIGRIPSYAEVVHVGGAEFLGVGATPDEARLKAVQSAIAAVNYSFSELAVAGVQSTGSLVLDQLQYKSPVSLVHELSRALRFEVAYEEVMASGPSHKREYTVACCVRRSEAAETENPLSAQANVLVAAGKGQSKRAARDEASRLMIYRMENEWGPLVCPGISKQIFGAQHLANGKRRGALLLKDRKMDPNYGDMINPVSRLIQLRQAQGEPDPVFCVTQMASRSAVSSEFIVKVNVDGIETEGRAPNKRLAKRYAAEAMLARLGYAKPLPEPPAKPAIKMNGSSKLNTLPSQPSSTDEGFDEAIIPPPELACPSGSAGPATVESRRIRFDADSLRAGVEGSGKGFRKQKCSRQGLKDSLEQLEQIAQKLSISYSFSDVEATSPQSEAFTTLSLSSEDCCEIYENGPTTEEARERAARAAVRHLQSRMEGGA